MRKRVPRLNQHCGQEHFDSGHREPDNRRHTRTLTVWNNPRLLVSFLLLAALGDLDAEPPAGPLAQETFLKADNAESGDSFGNAVAISGDTLVVGAELEDGGSFGVNGDPLNNGIHGSGAVYVYLRQGCSWVPQAYLKASNPGVSHHFGHAVALSGDTLVVGAPQENGPLPGATANLGGAVSGAAYVFVREEGVWQQQAYLKASNANPGDQFGYAVGIAGDTVVVGAFGEQSNTTGIDGNEDDNSLVSSGAAYIFVRQGTVWTQQAYLKASNAGYSNDSFGKAVAISGETVIVGATMERSSATGVNGSQNNANAASSGAAYVFIRNGNTWTQQAYLKASNTGARDGFGISVALADDTAVVGAWNEESNSTGVNGLQSNNSLINAGAAYVFVREGNVWSQQAYLKASNTGIRDRFGYSVAVAEDVVVVGTIHEDAHAFGVQGGGGFNDLAPESGAAYVFVRTSQQWTHHAYLKPGNTHPDAHFGSSLAIDGATLVVGSDGENSIGSGVNAYPFDLGATDSGAAYTFRWYGDSEPPETLSATAAAAGLTGLAALPGAVPFADGLANAVKHAFNLDLSGTDDHALTAGSGTSGLPSAAWETNDESLVFRYEYVRRLVNGPRYTLKRSPTLSSGSWESLNGNCVIEPIDAVWQRVIYEEIIAPDAPRSFYVLELEHLQP